jgi:hypothetical protein
MTAIEVIHSRKRTEFIVSDALATDPFPQLLRIDHEIGRRHDALVPVTLIARNSMIGIGRLDDRSAQNALHSIGRFLISPEK